MNEPLTFPARDILLSVLQRNHVQLLDIVAILALFQLCAADPQQPIAPATLCTALQKEMERLDPSGQHKINAVHMLRVPMPPQSNYN